MDRDPYEVLGISRGASLTDVRAAYRRLVELYHPDRLQQARPAVQAEATRLLREAIDALHAIEHGVARLRDRPLDARRATGGKSRGEPQGGSSEGSGRRAMLDPDRFGPRVRIFDAELEAVSPLPALHVRWGGRHARAALAALDRMYGAGVDVVRQVEWGAYELELDGTDMRRLLGSLVPEDPGAHEPVVVVAMATSVASALLADGGPPPHGASRGQYLVAMHRVLSLLEPDGRYTLLVDSL